MDFLSGNVRLNYGTAGFRAKAHVLQHAMRRCGMIAALRSAASDGAASGVMVTASHNPPCDNGVKIVERDGGMFRPEFESLATDFVNATEPKQALDNMISVMGIKKDSPALVCVGRDTRDSSPAFAAEVIKGAELLGAVVVDCGIVTTPMLHWLVCHLNEQFYEPTKGWSRQKFDQEELHRAYFDHFHQKIGKFVSLTKPSIVPRTLICDGAAGVGGLFMSRLQPSFDMLGITLEMRNKPAANLNTGCGAEFVQKERKLPLGFQDAPNAVCCSLDGDADRLVYFLIPSTDDQPLPLLDGDRLAVVFAETLINLLNDCVRLGLKSSKPLRVGVVQTAYANGASTIYLANQAARLGNGPGLTFQVATAKTGVKNLHHVATQFDIAVYFEANGHGTLIFDHSNVTEWVKANAIENNVEWARLESFLHMFNASTGDAMIDALAFEACLKYLKLDVSEALSLYQDYTVVQSKVPMSRSKLDLLVAHPEHERWLVSPVELQTLINNALDECPKETNARAFVRASGTEDVCRVYAEASDAAVAQALAKRVESLLTNF